MASPKSKASIEDDDLLWEDEDQLDNSKGNIVSDLDREWQARQKQFHTVGYRDGLLAGKESSVQEGFNEGFRESVLAGCNWGLVHGITSAFAFLPMHLKEKLVEASEGRSKLQALHGKVHLISGKDALAMFHQDVLKRKAIESTSKLEENMQVHSQESHHTLEVQANSALLSYASSASELGDLQRQLDSLLQSTTLKPTHWSP
eukprot:Gb_14769 [translate_table: standard]